MGIWGIHGDLVGNHGKYWIPSGELTVCNGTIQHFVAGKIHDFDWAIFHCYVSSPEGRLCEEINKMTKKP